MTKVVHPYGHRIGVIRGWKNNWFSGDNQTYRTTLRQDYLIHQFLTAQLKNKLIADISFERRNTSFVITIATGRPGLVIGKGGEGVTQLTQALKKFLKKQRLEIAEDIKIKIEEIKFIETNAATVAESMIEMLEKRMPFRRVMKQMAEKVINNRDVQGVRILLAGRLNGADIARSEQVKRGRVPLQTLRADIDYSNQVAMLPYGTIGLKVWIYRGDIYNKK